MPITIQSKHTCIKHRIIHRITGSYCWRKLINIGRDTKKLLTLMTKVLWPHVFGHGVQLTKTIEISLSGIFKANTL